MHTFQLGFGLVASLVLLAVLFDFMNGFHDAANSIATVVSTGVLRPPTAVLFASFFLDCPTRPDRRGDENAREPMIERFAR